MKLNTRLFGPVEYTEHDIISFPNGLPSFESEHAFLLLPIAGSEDSLYCLQSILNPTLSFILMNPFSLDSGYAPELSPEDRKLLQVEKDQDLCFYVLCAMKRPVESSTVNMKCPVALNPDINVALQVILEDEHWNMRHPLSQFAAQKEDPNC